MRNNMKFKLLVLLLISSPVFAEVSDKIPTMSRLWTQGMIAGGVLLLLTWWSWWFSIPGVLVAIFSGLSSYATFSDPHMGPAIINEQGTTYIISSYGSSAVILIGVIVGIILNRVTPKVTHNKAGQRRR